MGKSSFCTTLGSVEDDASAAAEDVDDYYLFAPSTQNETINPSWTHKLRPEGNFVIELISKLKWKQKRSLEMRAFYGEKVF